MDRNLRDLERAYASYPSPETRDALHRARMRAGLPMLERDRVIHYVPIGNQHRLMPNGMFDPSTTGVVISLCNGAELYPRRWREQKRRQPNWADDKIKVTCKNCLKMLLNPAFKEGQPVMHFLCRADHRADWTLCGTPKIVFSTTDRQFVTCPKCFGMLRRVPDHGTAPGLNARARRRLRRKNDAQTAAGV